ncbi:MAG TPA: GNAT family N-acetyltransferase [Saprospiraceae bacterium]|nr:GNAT family N-acetyltransferase [Saprospiraceae bacterium]
MDNPLLLMRRITDADIDELRKLAIDSFIETYSWANTEENMQLYVDKYFSVNQLREEINYHTSQFYFALLENKAIGYIKLNFGQAQTDIKEDNNLELERIYVLKDFQANRVGYELMQKAIQIADEYKKDYLWLGVWEKNEKAIKFYEKNGFIPFAHHPFMLGDELQSDILMKLVIKS